MRKAALLAMLLAAAMLLSSCYESPTDITQGDTLTVGSNNLPFENIAIATTAAPTPTPTPTPSQNDGVSQINWADWGTTPDPSTATQPPQDDSQSPTLPPTPTDPPSNSQSTQKPQQQDDSVLRSGSSGDAVSQLQKKLKDLGYYTGSVDGSYGAGTVNAVKSFQQVNGLDADGIAGKQTQDAVYSYYAIPKPKDNTGTNTNTGSNATAKPRATATPRPTATPNLTNARVLTVGYTGSDVRQVQNRLISLGYLAGTADGSYGETTAAAVVAFQKKAKVWDDGKAGPETQKKMFASNAPKASSAVAYVGESLKEGMDGAGVRALQNRLITLDYLKGPADGDFGAGTKAAVMAFQQDNGLKQDGIAGMATLNKLFASDAGEAGNPPSNGPTNPPTSGGNGGYTTLREGDTGDKVKRLQQKLKDLGYYSGSVDGDYGSGTITAVQNFQAATGLTVDGVAGPATQQRLYGDTSSYNKVIGSLKQFDEGPNVLDTQYTLYELGYFQDTINGIYGESTFNAVKEFQMINGLKVDGVAGNATLNILFSIAAKPATTAGSEEYATLMKGDEGEEVALLQSMLYELGYMTSGYTGVFDDETFEALKSFQQYNGLPVDGIAGAVTLERLYSDAAVRNPLAN
jgi:peptidoglycan hydrolase-like protein with peptidoglycan-binding domain